MWPCVYIQASLHVHINACVCVYVCVFLDALDSAGKNLPFALKMKDVIPPFFGLNHSALEEFTLSHFCIWCVYVHTLPSFECTTASKQTSRGLTSGLLRLRRTKIWQPVILPRTVKQI